MSANLLNDREATHLYSREKYGVIKEVKIHVYKTLGYVKKNAKNWYF